MSVYFPARLFLNQLKRGGIIYELKIIDLISYCLHNDIVKQSELEVS